MLSAPRVLTKDMLVSGASSPTQRLDCKQNTRVETWKGGAVLSVLVTGFIQNSDSTRAGTEVLPVSGLEKKPLVIGAGKEAPCCAL